MTNLTFLNAVRASRAEDNNLISPLETLEDTANDIRSGELVCNKLIVIALDTGDDGEKYELHWNMSHFKTSEVIALCEALKTEMLKRMGLI